ncbi:MAG: hypothetical protein J7577_15530 [Sphingobacteriaceae bacterium]|nr:hypothetical protein [Sphingobacteriaceae bacterium]
MKLIFRLFSFLSFLLFIVPAVQAQKTCNCPEAFRWTKETFEKNDAGFEYAIQQKGRDMYDKHTAIFSERVKTVKDQYECAEVLSEWLKFFRKGHLSIGVLGVASQPGEPAVNTKQWPVLTVSEKDIRQKAGKDEKDYAGIWHTGAYTIGIVKEGKSYKGVILESTNPDWKRQQVKMEIKEDGSGIYYMGNFSPAKFDKIEWMGKNAVKLTPSVMLERVFPKFSDTEDQKLYLRELFAKKPFVERLSKETLLLRIPSFGDQQKPVIDSVLSAFDKEIKSTKNLIIDIRNGTGGSDDSYTNLIPLLYTNPIRIVGLEFLSTPLNNKRMEGYLSLPDLSEKSRKQVNDALKLLNDNLGKFVNLNGVRRVTIQKLDTVLPFPQQVAVIANEANGSTDEQFLLAAKQSKKVKIFGKTTFGVLDISNMYSAKSPDGMFELGYCLSKSYRIPGMAIDNIGIQPDYFLDATIPNELWVKYAASVLENREFQQ